MQDERGNLYMEICSLKASLTSDASEIGDWKVVKCYEYALVGLPVPYDIVELNKQRQEVRDKINELQVKLGMM